MTANSQCRMNMPILTAHGFPPETAEESASLKRRFEPQFALCLIGRIQMPVIVLVTDLDCIASRRFSKILSCLSQIHHSEAASLPVGIWRRTKGLQSISESHFTASAYRWMAGPRRERNQTRVRKYVRPENTTLLRQVFDALRAKGFRHLKTEHTQ